MQIPPEWIRCNLKRIQNRIAEAAARTSRLPDAVKLIAVTKTVSIEEIRVLYQLGVRHFGENRIENAQNKIEELRADATWHMIGSVQRRKVNDVLHWFDTVDSVDRIELADTLNSKCGMLQRKPLDILLEVNVSGETAKHGFRPDEVDRVIEHIQELPNIEVRGLMTMAPLFDDPEKTRPVFAALRELALRHGLVELSMGMSNDFDVAIEEGATQVRIGTALFQEI